MAEEGQIYTKLELIMPHYSTATRQGSQYAGFPWMNVQDALIFIPYSSYDDKGLPTVEVNDYPVADPEFELGKSNIYDLVRNHYYDSEPVTTEKGELSKDDPIFDEYRYLTVQIYAGGQINNGGSWIKFGETHRVEFEDYGRDTYAIRGDKLFANPDVLFGSDEMLPIYLIPQKPYIRVCLGAKPDGSDANKFVAGYYVASDIYTYYNLYDAVALMGRNGYGSNYDLANSLRIYITAYDENHTFLDQDYEDSNVYVHVHAMEPVKANLIGGKYVGISSVTPDIRSGDHISKANPDNAYVYSQPVTGISYSKLLGLSTDEVDALQADTVNYYIVDADGQPVFYHTEANKTTFDAANLLSNNTNFKLVSGISRINTNGTMQLKDLVIEHVFKNRADKSEQSTVAVKFHQAVALNIAREEEMPEVPEEPEVPSMGQRVVTTTDLDQTIIITPQKKVAVNVDNKTIGLINGKLGVLGGAGAGISAPTGFKVVDSIGSDMPEGDYFFITTPEAKGCVNLDKSFPETEVPNYGSLEIRDSMPFSEDDNLATVRTAIKGDVIPVYQGRANPIYSYWGVKISNFVKLYVETYTNFITLTRYLSTIDFGWNVSSGSLWETPCFKGSLNNMAYLFEGELAYTCFIANTDYGITGFPVDFESTKTTASSSLYSGSEIIRAHVRQNSTAHFCTQTIMFEFNDRMYHHQRLGIRNQGTLRGTYTFGSWYRYSG
nr:MAG: hypothetical protein [Enquatrovirus sp.]